MIRINLLAEAQVAEDLRRRDPVKRAIWGGSFLAGLMLLWVAGLQLQLVQARGRLHAAEATWKTLAPGDALIKSNLTRTVEMQRKLDALSRLATNRFLWSAPLDALQFCMVDNIDLTELSVRQTYRTNAPLIDPNTKKILKPAASTEEIGLVLKGNDYAPGSEGNHTRFMEAIAQNPYFREHLRKPDAFANVSRSLRTSETGEARRGSEFSFTCQFAPAVRTK